MYGKVKEDLTKEIKSISDAGLYKAERIIMTPQGAEIEVKEGRKVLNFCANNYLGLSSHPKVIEAAHKTLDEWGYGMSSVRFICGTQDIHKVLEQKISQFLHTEDTILFAACFDANGGVFEPLLTAEDAIITDQLNHASIIDGIRLCKAQRFIYKHGDMADLEEKLKETQGTRYRMIATDGVFSMDGDIAKLDEICDLADKYKAMVMIDDAHSCGVLGKNGRGTGEHFDMENDIDLIMGTFSKSFASIGGFIAGEHKVINYIKHHARAFIFSASMPPSAVATVSKAVDILIAEPERLDQLWKNARKMKKGFDEMGFNTGTSETPIIPIIIGDDLKTFYFWKLLFENGIFTNPVISPAVESGRQLLRTSYMATHTDDELDQVLETFHQLGKQFGLIQ